MKCQVVECGKEGDGFRTEQWNVDGVGAFVVVCNDHGLTAKAGSRTAIVGGEIVRKTGQAFRREVA